MRPVSPKFAVPRAELGDYADEYLSQINSVLMVAKVNTAGRRFHTLFNVRSSDHLFDAEKLELTMEMRRGVVLGGLQKKKD